MAVDPHVTLSLFGYDAGPAMIEIARKNAALAREGEDIVFEAKDINDLWIDREYGILISNPPYGQLFIACGGKGDKITTGS